MEETRPMTLHTKEEEPAEEETPKICPLLSALYKHMHPCLREKCAMYVKIYKAKHVGSFTDPMAHLEYEGCGLLREIPWRVVQNRRRK